LALKLKNRGLSKDICLGDSTWTRNF